MPFLQYSLSKKPAFGRISIWLIGVSFVLFQFFLQLSSGVIINSIMIEMKLTGLMTGILSSSFYLIYTSLQIPAGVLFDKKCTRSLLTITAIICSIGCFLFARNHTLTGLILTRLIIGGGASFAFIGVAQILRQHFPLRQFTFMIGLSETLGFLATVLGMVSLGSLVSTWGWRLFMQGAGFVGLLIAVGCWIIIPKQIPQKQTHHTSTLNNLITIITNPIAWINGLFVALGFTIVTVFAAMWAVPFLKLKLHCNLEVASFLDALFFLGVAISCPLLGYFAGSAKKRKPLLIGSSLVTAVLLMLLLYYPTQSVISSGVTLLLIGLCCGGYMVAYSISNELAPENAQSTATGFTNTMATLSPLLQPLIGRFIDTLDAVTPNDSLAHYQYALTIIPAGLLFAGFLAMFLPEKKIN